MKQPALNLVRFAGRYVRVIAHGFNCAIPRGWQATHALEQGELELLRFEDAQLRIGAAGDAAEIQAQERKFEVRRNPERLTKPPLDEFLDDTVGNDYPQPFEWAARLLLADCARQRFNQVLQPIRIVEADYRPVSQS